MNEKKESEVVDIILIILSILSLAYFIVVFPLMCFEDFGIIDKEIIPPDYRPVFAIGCGISFIVNLYNLYGWPSDKNEEN